ncbi:MAG: nitrilase-related carbon-nitrogen hydrolase [Pseudomonadota bacterium]
MKDTTLALAIQNCIPGKIQANLENCINLTREASRKGADMILFPEMNLTGYISGKAIQPLAQPVPCQATQALVTLARQESITILAGLAETDEQGHVYSSHLVIDPCGILGIYRKTHIAPPEKKVYTPGESINTFNTPLMTLGIQICYDSHFPEMSTAMALKGADILCIPHASPRGASHEKFSSWMRHLTARAFDNGVFVAACNQVGDNGNGLVFPGIALVLGPDGNILARHETATDSLVTVKLKKSQLDRVRNHRMRYFLPNRRGDLY